jgi:hypothetical protein
VSAVFPFAQGGFPGESASSSPPILTDAEGPKDFFNVSQGLIALVVPSGTILEA